MHVSANGRTTPLFASQQVSGSKVSHASIAVAVEGKSQINQDCYIKWELTGKHYER
jgi:hypothetical protein